MHPFTTSCLQPHHRADWPPRIWLIDVCRQLPSARLDGFDVSTAQYPPKEWLPSNISLQTLDVFAPIPKDLQNKYDVVNVRLFLAVVKNNDPSPILRNLMKMLSKSLWSFDTLLSSKTPNRTERLPTMVRAQPWRLYS